TTPAFSSYRGSPARRPNVRLRCSSIPTIRSRLRHPLRMRSRCRWKSGGRAMKCATQASLATNSIRGANISWALCAPARLRRSCTRISSSARPSPGASLSPAGRDLRGRSVLRHRLSAAFLGFFQTRQVECAVDERYVRECLREVADQPTGARIILLAQQSDVVSQVEQPPEQYPRVVPAVLHDVGVDQPKAAGEEGALPCGQTVRGACAVVAHH